MQKRIGILRGGLGDNYHYSLRRGGELLSYLTENLGEKYKPVDILIDREGVWHLAGRPIQLSDLMHRVDLIWNVAHANHSHSLDSLSVPHLSAAPFFEALKSSKQLLREHLRTTDVSLPRSVILPVYQADFDGPADRYAMKKAIDIHAKFGAPWIVKSFAPEQNMGMHLAKTFPELVSAITDGIKHKDSIIVEEFITGSVGAFHSVVGFRGEEIYVFPQSPGSIFSPTEKEKLNALVKDLHRHLNAEHYLKSDLLITPRGKVYLLEFENTPDLKSGSHLHQACEHSGTNINQLVEHMLENTGKL